MSSMREGEIVIVDDQDEIRSYVIELFEDQGFRARGFEDGEAALAYVREDPDRVSLSVLDIDLGVGKRTGLELIPDIKEIDPSLPVIILTGKGSLDLSVQAIRAGAVDFLEKDHHLGQRVELSIEKVERLLSAAREARRVRRDLEHAETLRREDHQKRYRIVGDSKAIQDVIGRVERVAAIPRPVMVLGERGTGKELVAGAIHAASDRASKPFIVLNVAAVPEALLDSELFGHEKGAFTGATSRRAGRFELADGGTLFLDEVGNMPMDFQKKILRALEYPRFERAGGQAAITVDVRVIAATNADLEADMHAGRFRRDLYDRLAFEVIRLPPLRDRVEDVPVLAQHFVDRFRDEVPGLTAQAFSEDALGMLTAYRFPGNVRELKAIVERAAYLCSGDRITPGDLQLSDAPATPGGSTVTAAAPAPAAPAQRDSRPLPERIAELERQACLEVLEETGWNQKESARVLGLSYDQFRHLYRKHGLKRANQS